MTEVSVRRCTEADWPLILGVDSSVFGFDFDEEADAPDRAVLELDRSLLAHVGDEAVGHSTAYTLAMSVPGGEVSAGGVTWVSVLGSHRRRGVLTSMMEQLTTDMYERGEPVAALFASEPMIYGRFGYGPASSDLALTIPTARASVVGPEDGTLRVRLTNLAGGRASVEQVYAAMRGRRAGMPSRDGRWWARCMNDAKPRRHGGSARQCAIVEGPLGPRGYAVYTVVEKWTDGSAEAAVRVHEQACLDAPAAVALWRLLLSLDLVATISCESMAVDDPLLHLLADPRRTRPQLKDAVYVRLLDLPKALAARTYDVAYDGVVEVIDEKAPWNAGRWRLALHPDGAECERTGAEPDLVLDVRELGAAYLGGTSLHARALAGHVAERTPGAAAAAARAFRHDPAPFCPYIF